MKTLGAVVLSGLVALLQGCQNGHVASTNNNSSKAWAARNPVWRGLHVMLANETAARSLNEELPALSQLGVNVLIVEVNYGFAFDSHPALRGSNPITKEAAGRLATTARENGIRLIPQFNCLGHQSWSGTTFSLLTKYPAFDETPGQFPGNTNLYCRSWCPQNPDVNKVVFALIDELIDSFHADAFHVGMDEVFLIASEHCPRCAGGNPATLFARAVGDLHRHLVGERKVEMLMWGDRLLDAKTTGYGKWEAADNGTAGAVDLISKDILICDWHYEVRDAYPSVPFFQDKGFRVWPAGWRNVEAVNRLLDYSQDHRGPRMVGYFATTWGATRGTRLSEWLPLVTAMKRLAASPERSRPVLTR